MGNKLFSDFFEKYDVTVIRIRRHALLKIHDVNEENIYILKDGVVKVSVLMLDGREFNITYLKGFDAISMFKDAVNKSDFSSLMIRVESDEASFYRIPKELFMGFVKENAKLQEYVNSYYRKKLSETISRQKLMTMNSKNGAMCAFLYYLVTMFGKEVRDGILIDLKITNDDIAGFCGISTRNSVNRILRGLREEHVIRTLYNKILVLDVEYLKQYVDIKVDSWIHLFKYIKIRIIVLHILNNRFFMSANRIHISFL